MAGEPRARRRELGQFFTARSLALFAWELVALFMTEGASRRPQLHADALEPAAGEGVFLEAAIALGVPAERLVGFDRDAQLATAWQRLRASHHGLTLYEADTLLDHPALEQPFQLIIGNPPFARAPRARYPFSQIPAGRSSDRVALEALFVERSLRLVRPGGWIALILPEGWLTNKTMQRARDWTWSQACLRACITLPHDGFRRADASARTALVIWQKAEARHRVLLDEGEHDLARAGILEAAQAWLSGAPLAHGAALPPEQLQGERWDAAYWRQDSRMVMEDLEARMPHASLGSFIQHLTYGPIVTGRPRLEPTGEVAVLTQRELVASGIWPLAARKVPAGSVYDPPRSRPEPGDLLFARSGVGSLGKGRMAVLATDLRANLGCFVDLIRLQGLDPYFAWLFLASRFGQSQIRRVINGVAMPNLSFNELRALRIPRLSPSAQAELGALYAQRVAPAHAQALARPEDPALRAAAAAAMILAIAAFEEALLA